MSEASPLRGAPPRVGRYTLHAEIASGGMATVYYGQMLGAHGFSRVVAIKRMLPRLARDPRFHAMFVDEARLASRVQHPNVVPILDVVDEHGEVMIVMEYVRGPSLSALLDATLRNGSPVPIAVVANIGCAMLSGLHAAHEARDRRGRSLGIVHRDVSPQNVLVGVDGVTRIMDFGVAKATELGQTEDGTLTGKLCYMAPEQFDGTGVDRRTDVFATAVVLWGALAGRRLFRAASVDEAMQDARRGEFPPLAEIRSDVPAELEATIHRALDPARARRPETAEAFAAAIEAAAPIASPRAVADWVSSLAGATVTERDAVIVQIEKTRTTMAISAPASAEEGDLVRSDVLTADWIRDQAGLPRASPSSVEPTLDGAAPIRARRSYSKPVLLAAAAALASGIAAAFWLSTPSAPPLGMAPAASVAPAPAPETSASAEPAAAAASAASAAPSSSAPTRAQVPRARTGGKPQAPSAPGSAAPKPPATRGREPYLPSSPFGN